MNLDEQKPTTPQPEGFVRWVINNTGTGGSWKTCSKNHPARDAKPFWLDPPADDLLEQANLCRRAVQVERDALQLKCEKLRDDLTVAINRDFAKPLEGHAGIVQACSELATEILTKQATATLRADLARVCEYRDDLEREVVRLRSRVAALGEALELSTNCVELSTGNGSRGAAGWDAGFQEDGWPEPSGRLDFVKVATFCRAALAPLCPGCAMPDGEHADDCTVQVPR